jgi:hypothetical protein
MLRNEVWATIAKPRAVRYEPEEPDLFSWADVRPTALSGRFKHICVEYGLDLANQAVRA